MKKRTAVWWLINELHKKEQGLITTSYNHIFDKAKEMEKEQHGETWDQAMKNYEERGGNFSRAWADFDEYYNEKF